MRLFKEEGNVQRAKFYPRIIPLINFLTNVSLIIYFANKFSWTNACFKGHFIVQVLMRLQPCGHSRWVLLLKIPDDKFFNWLLPIKNNLMYFQLHCIRQQSSRNKSARKLKKLLFLFSKKKKRQTKQKAKASKSFGNPCVQKKQTKTNEQGKVWVSFGFRFTRHFPIMIYSRECPISLFNLWELYF